jgi:alanyl-tRNA synthetase
MVVETLKLEETRFRQTLDRGLKLLDEEIAKLAAKAPLPGDVAFRLYDTFGFPLDLTQDILRGQGRSVDLQGFEDGMAKQRAAARKAWAGSGEAATEKLWFEIRDRVGATDFLGYATEQAEGVVTALLKDGREVEALAAGERGMAIANQSPFYGESGGQMGDTGILFAADGTEFVVEDTQKKLGDMHVHIGQVTKGRLAKGMAIEMSVDGSRRSALRANHSATHLLHEALRRTLGDHVTQKGSLVAPDRLRFDFSHPKPMTDAELETVEAMVNERIRHNAAVATTLMTPDDAVAAGALALFGEKYGDEVRVVGMGGTEEGRSNFSVELCGGTHVRRTGDIGLFHVLGESAVAAGVRRIEAVTGKGAEAYLRNVDGLLHEAAAALKIQPAELPQRVAALMDERRRLERELTEARKQLATGAGAGRGNGLETREIGGVRFAAQLVDGVPAKELKGMADGLKKQIGSGVVTLIARDEGRASIVVGVTDDLTDRISAVDLVRVGSEALGGKGGGGRPDMAQAGGPDGDAAPQAIAAIERALGARNG